MKKKRPSKKYGVRTTQITRHLMVREGPGEYVTDTHPLIWHLWNSSKLSGAAKRVFEMGDQGEATVLIPAMCLVETVFLIESAKIPEQLYDRLLETLHKDGEDGSYQLVPMTLETASCLRLVPRHLIRELPDRVIAATAVEREAPLITKDEALRGWDGIATLW